MNYIYEINEFYKWLIENPISGNTQALWHRLMGYCNSFGWKNEFTLTNTRLSEDLNLSKQEISRIRNILCEKGLIVYKKGEGNKCGTYHINSFESQNLTDSVIGNVTQSVQSSLSLNKQNKTKQNKTKQTYARARADENHFVKKSKFNNFDSDFGENLVEIQRRLTDELYNNS